MLNAVLAVNLAAVRLQNGAADRQAQTDAGRGGLLVAAFEFLENRLLAPRRQARAVVLDGDAHLVAVEHSADADLGAWLRVLGGVLQQVHQHALKHRGVQMQ